MTLVYCWFDHSPNSPHGPWPWVVADSRFSYPGDTQQILLDEGAKIFSFPLTSTEVFALERVYCAQCRAMT